MPDDWSLRITFNHTASSQVLGHLAHDGAKLTCSVLGFCEGSDFQPNVSPQRLEKRNLSVLA